MNFFRLQDAGLTISKMRRFNSADGGDGYKHGLCVSDRPDRFGGAEGAYGSHRPGEVVVLKGTKVAEIYDGYRIRPTEIVARFSWATWQAMLADGTAWDYEDWN